MIEWATFPMYFLVQLLVPFIDLFYPISSPFGPWRTIPCRDFQIWSSGPAAKDVTLYELITITSRATCPLLIIIPLRGKPSHNSIISHRVIVLYNFYFHYRWHCCYIIVFNLALFVRFEPPPHFRWQMKWTTKDTFLWLSFSFFPSSTAAGNLFVLQVSRKC